jgi:hypothetical protein
MPVISYLSWDPGDPSEGVDMFSLDLSSSSDVGDKGGSIGPASGELRDA